MIILEYPTVDPLAHIEEVTYNSVSQKEAPLHVDPYGHKRKRLIRTEGRCLGQLSSTGCQFSQCDSEMNQGKHIEVYLQ